MLRLVPEAEAAAAAAALAVGVLAVLAVLAVLTGRASLAVLTALAGGVVLRHLGVPGLTGCVAVGPGGVVARAAVGDGVLGVAAGAAGAAPG